MSIRGARLIQGANPTVHVVAHGEAFCLMKYVNRSTRRTEWFWNSRDGVTPFLLRDPEASRAVYDAWVAAVAALEPAEAADFTNHNPDPSMMQHMDMKEDAPVPNFVPPVGMRIFMSWGEAPPAIRAELQALWDERIADSDNREELAKLEPFDMKPGSPVVAVVTEALAEHFMLRAVNMPWRPAPAGGFIQTH